MAVYHIFVGRETLATRTVVQAFVNIRVTIEAKDPMTVRALDDYAGILRQGLAVDGSQRPDTSIAPSPGAAFLPFVRIHLVTASLRQSYYY